MPTWAQIFHFHNNITHTRLIQTTIIYYSYRYPELDTLNYFRIIMKITVGLLFVVAGLQGVLSQILAVDFGTQFIKSALVGQGMGKSFAIVENHKSSRKFINSIGFYNEQRFYEEQSLPKRPKLPTNCFLFTKLLIDSVVNPSMTSTIKKDLFLDYINTETADQLMAEFVLQNLPEGSNQFTLVEIVAMILKYSKSNAEKQFGVVIKDAIITVPNYWNLRMRAFIVEAAQVAELYVLSLISENTGAAINYALNQKQKNQNETILFYNVGSNSLQMTLVEYRPVEDPKLKTPVESIFVKADLGLPYVGGLRFDRIVFQYFQEQFEAKYSKQLTKRAKIKLFQAGNQIKEVLSANKEATIFVEGLMDGIDYSEKISREQFEKRSQELLNTLISPVKGFLLANNVKPEDLSSVELIGGSIRVPKVQEMLAEVIGNQSKIGTHINGDEAMVLGAAFYGANSSKKFKIKGLHLYDGFNFEIRAVLSNLEQGIEEDDPRYFHKNVTIFKKKSRFGMTKELNFKCTQNIIAEFYREDQDGLELIKKVKFTDISKVNETDFKVSVTLAIDPVQTLTVKKANIKYKRQQTSTYIEKIKKDTPKTYNQQETEQKNEQQKNQQTDDSQAAQSGTNQQKQSDEQVSKDTQNENDDDELPKKKKKKSKKPKTKIEYETVQKNKTVTKSYEKQLKFKTIYSHEIEDHQNTEHSKQLLKKYQRNEHAQKMLHESRNKLEALVYEVKDKLDNEEFLKFVQDAEKEKLLSLVTEKSDWQDQNFSNDKKQYDSHFKELNKPFDKINKRISQYEGREVAKDKAMQEVNKYEQLAKNITVKKSWIEEEVVEDFKELIEGTNDEIESISIKMSETPLNESPTYVLSDYEKLALKIKEEYFKIMATPEPKKPKKAKEEEEKEQKDESEEL